MCKCTPNIKTPYCGKGDCQWPERITMTDNTSSWEETFAEDFRWKEEGGSVCTHEDVIRFIHYLLSEEIAKARTEATEECKAAITYMTKKDCPKGLPECVNCGECEDN